MVGLLGIKDTPGDRPRRQGQRGRNVGSIPKREAAGFDKRGDRSNGSVGRFSGKIKPLSSFFRSVVLEVPGDVLGMQILRPTSELLTVPGRAQHR